MYARGMRRAALLILLCWGCGQDPVVTNDALAGTWLPAYSSPTGGRLDLTAGPHGVFGHGALWLPDGGTQPFAVSSDAHSQLVMTFPDGTVDTGYAAILPNCLGQPIPPPWQINSIVAP